MSEFLDKDHYRIENINALFKDNLDFNPAESLLFAGDQLWKYVTGGETTRGATIVGAPLLGIYAERLVSGSYVITEKNAKLLYLDLNDWINERIGLGVFSNKNPFGVYSNYTDEQKKKMLESSDNSVLKLFMDQGHLWSTRSVGGQTELYPKKLLFREQDANFIKPFTEHVIKMSETSALDKATTKLIGEFVRENVTFNEYQRAISKLISENIRKSPEESRFAPRGLGIPPEEVDYYIGFSLNDDGFYTLSEKIYGGEQTKVPKDALSEDEVKSFKYPSVLKFPTSIIRDQNDNVIPELKKELEEFKELEDTLITDYRFKFQRDAVRLKGGFGADLTETASSNLIWDSITGFLNDKITSSEQISAWVTLGYIEFLVSLIEDLENGSLGTTIMTHFNEAVNSVYTLQIQEYILFEKIIAAKKTFFDNIAAATSEDSPGGSEVTEEERENAYKNSMKAFKVGQGDKIPDPPSEEDIENRQKYFKQCALMLNLPKLRDVYQLEMNVKYQGVTPYHGRFVTVRSKDKEQESTLSQLVSSAKEQKLFELESYKVSKLVPKIRLFKVFQDGGKEREVEFIFDRTSNIRSSFMSSEKFDKGTGVGLKNFSFEFNGTTPAEARNDIAASLTLFFQSFQDFTRDRNSYNEEPYRFVDLVIQPTPDKKGKVGGISVQSNRQYEAQFYRIRAEVGYVVPTEDDGFTSDEINAIRVSNKSFFLNMVDHDISFGKDGTVEIKISYRAYLESLLKHPKLDALASPELIEKRMQNARELTDQLNKRECSVEQIKELQMSLAAQESVILKQSLSSIITRLKQRNSIFSVKINVGDKQDFIKFGFFNQCRFDNAVTTDATGGDVGLVLNTDLPESSEDFDFIDSDDANVQFFFFGDLLYTILDCVYDENNKVRNGTGFDRNSILLTSFEFEPFQSGGSGGTNVYNIADIPISVDYFSRWFVDNVISQKSTRKTFPVMNFIRNLSNHLIKPTVTENCVNRKMENRLRFQTAQVSAYEPKGKNPLLPFYSLTKGARTPISLDVEDLRKSGPLPFKGGPLNDANSSYKDFHTFIVLSALGSTLSYAGRGVYENDIKQGRFHIHIGQNAGLVKTLSLSKSDQQYIREARFFQNGIDGLLQLSAVYVANIEMFGNTVFYPGMELFFNPYGIGGYDFDPRVQGSIANKLGIGGYHTITSVKSSITPGKFTTSISAQQYFSGDKTGQPNSVKKKESDQATTSIESYSPADPGNETGFKNCNNVILDAQNYAFEEGTLSGRLGESMNDPVEAPTPEEATDEIIGATSEVTTEEVSDAMFGAETPAYEVEREVVTETYYGRLLEAPGSEDGKDGEFDVWSSGKITFRQEPFMVGTVVNDESRIVRNG